MPYPHNLRAPVSPWKPEPVGICDRCGFLYPDSRLVWQFDWRGNAMANLRIRVCTDRCLDEPFGNNRPLLIPPDPEPIKDARPWHYASQSQGGSPQLEIEPDEGPTNLINDGGWLVIVNALGWPNGPATLPPGSLWSNGNAVSVIPGATPNPAARPIFFGSINSNDLLGTTGKNLPLSSPQAGSGQLWNNGGIVSIA